MLLLAMAGTAAAQDFQMSKRAKNFNFDVHTATDPDSGAVLVVWTELKPADSSYARVWAALLKRNKNGTYKRKKDVLISPNTGYHINPDVAWVKAAKAFAVVWDTRRAPGTDSDVMGRFVSPKKGKPVGPVRTLLGTGDAEFSPLLVVNNTSEPGGAIELLFMLEPAGARGVEEIKRLTHSLFDFEFNPSGEITRMSEIGSREAGFEFGLQFLDPDDAVALLVLDCGVVVINVFDGGRRFMEIYLVRQGVARLAHAYADATFSDLVVNGVGPNPTLRVTRKDDGSAALETDVFRVLGNWESLQLRPREAITLNFGVPEAPGPRLLIDDSLPMRVPEPQYGVASVDSETRFFRLREIGSPPTPVRELFSDQGKLTDLGGRVIPQTGRQRGLAEPPDALVWWLKNAGNSRQQVWVHLFSTTE